MRGRLLLVFGLLAALLVSSCTSTSSPAKSPGTSADTSPADIAAGRSAIEKALRGNTEVNYVEASLDFRSRKDYVVKIGVSSVQFAADVAKAAAAAASSVNTASLPEITITIDSGTDNNSVVLQPSTYHGRSHLPPPALIEDALQVLTNKVLDSNTSNLTIGVRDPILYVSAGGRFDTTAGSVALYKTLERSWRPGVTDISRIDIGESFVIRIDAPKTKVPTIADNVLTTWQAEVEKTPVIASTLEVGGSPRTIVYLTQPAGTQGLAVGKQWIDAMVRLGKPFAVRSRGATAQQGFNFDSARCAAPGSATTALLYDYYVALPAKRAGVQDVRKCR